MTTQTIGAFFDIDGTLTSDNVWKGIMNFFVRRSERRLTHAAFWAFHYPIAILRYTRLVSETTFRRQWALHLPWYFRGYDETQMKVLAEWVAHEHVTASQRPDVLEILGQHLAEGHIVALVSGAPTAIVKAIAEMWGVAHGIGSPAEFKVGRYTGGMTGDPCLDDHKAYYLKGYLKEAGLDVNFSASYVYADSYSDLGLFELVGNPMAVYPDKQLRLAAKERGWRIIGEDAKGF